MFKSNNIFVIVSRNGVVARVSYNPKKTKDTKRELVGDVSLSPNAAVTSTVNFTLGQIAEKGLEGRFTFVVHDDVAIRYYEYLNAIRNDEDAITALKKEWMEDDEEMLSAVEEFCAILEQLDNDAVSLNFVKHSNVYNWKLFIKQEGFQLEEGMEIDFIDGVGLDGAVVAETILSGKYIVVKHDDGFWVPRRGTSMNIINLRKTVEYAWSKCPAEINFEEGVVAGEDFFS